MATALLVLTAFVPFPWFVFPILPPSADCPPAAAATEQEATPEPMIQQSPANAVVPDGGKVLIARHRRWIQRPFDASGAGTASPSEAPARCLSCEAELQRKLPRLDAKQITTTASAPEGGGFLRRGRAPAAAPKRATNVMMMVTPKIEIQEEEEVIQVGALDAGRPGPIEWLVSDPLFVQLLQAGAAFQFPKRDAQREAATPSAVSLSHDMEAIASDK